MKVAGNKIVVGLVPIWFAGLFALEAGAEPREKGFVFGLGAQATVWDREWHGTHEGEGDTIQTEPTGGILLVCGYRINRFFEASLKLSLGFPNQILTEDTGGQEYRETGILLRLLPQAKLILPLDGWSMYASVQGGYSFFRDAATYQPSESHGATLGGGLGVEFRLSEDLKIFTEAEYLYQFDSDIQDSNAILRYDNVNLTVGVLF